MQIMYINNDGSGFADHKNIEPGTSVSKFFSMNVPHGDPSNYLIRVNRQPVGHDYILQEGDRVSITPTKIAGASVVIA